MAIFPTDYPYVAPAFDDLGLFSDTSNSDNLAKATLEDMVQAGMSALTSDDLPVGVTNLYLSPANLTKLNGIQTGAEVNQVNSVQGTQGNVILNLDQIPDGVTRKAGSGIYTTAKDGQLSTAYSHSQIISGNPHGTTAAMVGLGNVTNETQLSTTAGNFNALAQKPDTQQHLDDLFVIQDSSDADNIKSVKNQTMLIWYASMIQERGPSINYYDFTFVASTTYNIMSIVTESNLIYKCVVAHQSSGSFAVDYGLGYWVRIGGDGAVITTGSGSPVTPGVNVGDLYIDTLNNDLYYWDGTTWVLLINGSATGNVISDSIPATDRSVPVYNGITGLHIVESPVTIDGAGNVDGINNLDVDGDVNFNGGDVNFNGDTINYFNTTQNFVGTETLIACQVVPLFATPYTASVGTQLTKVVVTFDNGSDPVDTKTTNTLFNGATQNIFFNCGPDTGEIQISRALGDITVTIISGNPVFFTLVSICDYEGLAVNNYTDKIETYNNVTQEYINVQINGDIINNANNTFTSNNTFEGDTTIENLTVDNITIINPIAGMTPTTDSFTGDDVTTIFALSGTAINTNYLVFLNGLRQTPTTDYVATTTQVTFTVAPTTGDIILIDYLG